MSGRNDELCFRSATELAGMIRQKQLSPVELVDACLQRIEAMDTQINAFCTLVGDEARQEALRAEEAIMRGEAVGPLHGVPVAVKDLLSTEGIRTTFGSKLFANSVPERDAVAVRRVKQAGGIIVGKTNTPEFGSKVTTDNEMFGVTKNPWNTDRVPGGSSGGSAAAVASGFVPFSVATDSGGSIRIPASACGVYGLKPTYGRIPFDMNTANMFSSQNPFFHIGAISRTVADAALLFAVMTGPDPVDPYCLPDTGENFTQLQGGVKGLRIGYSPDFGMYEIDAGVRETIQQAVRNLGKLGCLVEQIDVRLEHSKAVYIESYMLLMAAQFANSFGSRLAEIEPLLSEPVVQMIRSGQEVRTLDYKKVEFVRTSLWNSFQNVFAAYDLLVTPTLAAPPFPHTQNGPGQINGKPVHFTDWVLTPFQNFTGHPAASVPVGFTPDRLPVGMQVIGPRFAERTVLQLSQAYEQAFPWEMLSFIKL